MRSVQIDQSWGGICFNLLGIKTIEDRDGESDEQGVLGGSEGSPELEDQLSLALKKGNQGKYSPTPDEKELQTKKSRRE